MIENRRAVFKQIIQGEHYSTSNRKSRFYKDFFPAKDFPNKRGLRQSTLKNYYTRMITLNCIFNQKYLTSQFFLFFSCECKPMPMKITLNMDSKLVLLCRAWPDTFLNTIIWTTPKWKKRLQNRGRYATICGRSYFTTPSFI